MNTNKGKKVSIIQNSGGGVIKVQTIVHITGPIESWRVKAHTTYVGEVFDKKTVNVEGKIWTIEYDVKYVYDKQFSADQLKPGENLLTVDPKTPSTGPTRTHVENRNNTGKLSTQHGKMRSVVYHETAHLIGFVDQYTEISGKSPEFEQYLRNKYNSKEDIAPGGMLYQMLTAARSDENPTIFLSNVGFENNEMNNNKGVFTDDQNKALVSQALSLSGGKDGTYILKGFFDTKGKPSEQDLNKAFVEIENRIKQKIEETPMVVPIKPLKGN